MWTFDLDYVTRNNSSSLVLTIGSNAMCVFYDCFYLCGSTSYVDHVTSTCSLVRCERFVKVGSCT